MRHFRALRVIFGLTLLIALGYAMPLHANLEHAFLFFPTSDQAGTPATVGLDYEIVDFTATDGQPLHGWLIPGIPEAPLVIFSMGNYGNMSHRIDNLRQLHDLGLSTFIYDYRGYGQSGGRSSEQGTFHDLRGAMNELIKRGWTPERMVCFGRSLGAAVTLQIALETPPAAVILETPFTSIAAMGRKHYWVLFTLLGWLLDAQYDNLAKISLLRSPLLILHGTRDSICPPEMAEQLFAAAPQPKRLVWLDGAGHNDTLHVDSQRYWMAWREFLAQHLGYTPPSPTK